MSRWIKNFWHQTWCLGQIFKEKLRHRSVQEKFVSLKDTSENYLSQNGLFTKFVYFQNKHFINLTDPLSKVWTNPCKRKRLTKLCTKHNSPKKYLSNLIKLRFSKE